MDGLIGRLECVPGDMQMHAQMDPSRASLGILLTGLAMLVSLPLRLSRRLLRWSLKAR